MPAAGRAFRRNLAIMLHRNHWTDDAMNDQAPTVTSKTQALARRYGADAVPAAGPWNQHLDLLLSHR